MLIFIDRSLLDLIYVVVMVVVVVGVVKEVYRRYGPKSK